jgi:hypothetical protein
MKDIKVKWQPTIAVIAGLGILTSVGIWLFSQLTTSGPAKLVKRDTIANQVPEVTSQQPLTIQVPIKQANTSANSTDKALPPAKLSADAIAKQQGLLRAGNLTDYPVRLALLSKQELSASKTSGQSSYEPPAHWDFEPGEGGNKGLTLSLPKQALTIKRGDILVAFAQDGSRRYWGPYVAGDTPFPKWNPVAAEWQLILQP